MDIRSDLKKIPEIIRGVRPLLLPYFGAVASVVKEGRAHDFVTQLDTDIENYLRDKFSEILPEIDFFGEEMGGKRSDRFWLVDPIDGTLCFIKGLPFCTTMVALIENGQVVFSAIYNFVTDTLYLAEVGKGAWENEKRIYVSDQVLHGAIIKLETKREEKTYEAFRDSLYRDALAFETFNAGFEFCMVASGKIEGRISLNPYGKDFDFAPGALLVKEAGGIVANINSDTYDYQNLDFIATNKKVYPEIVRLLHDKN
jgi:myo-inositol-1(or 4)-monophosphatase